MKFKKTFVSNFEGAFRGLRNPLNSWDRSDSAFGIAHFDDATLINDDISFQWSESKSSSIKDETNYYYYGIKNWLWEQGTLKETNNLCEYAFLGPKDLDLAQRMINAGTSDSKFMRQINVSVDITAPLYWY